MVRLHRCFASIMMQKHMIPEFLASCGVVVRVKVDDPRFQKTNFQFKTFSNREDSTLVPLSLEYSKKLESRVKIKIKIEKISVTGIYPATLWHMKLDPDCLPPIEATDLLSIWF
ncbi:unnamed protein product [Porites evermanni]|uniref:Uncharacterized protein n=1 Tax=Porites evermanni TaxID=104178 RepID=A0ABN8PFE2_9CNID|nr:unnamed protein product [Porites evermanni]